MFSVLCSAPRLGGGQRVVRAPVVYWLWDGANTPAVQIHLWAGCFPTQALSALIRIWWRELFKIWMWEVEGKNALAPSSWRHYANPVKIPTSRSLKKPKSPCDILRIISPEFQIHSLPFFKHHLSSLYLFFYPSLVSASFIMFSFFIVFPFSVSVSKPQHTLINVYTHTHTLAYVISQTDGNKNVITEMKCRASERCCLVHASVCPEILSSLKKSFSHVSDATTSGWKNCKGTWDNPIMTDLSVCQSEADPNSGSTS